MLCNASFDSFETVIICSAVSSHTFISCHYFNLNRLSTHLAMSEGKGSLYPLFKSQEIANLVWSYATLNVEAPEMIDIIADYTVAICSRDKQYDESSISHFFKRQELANLSWSLAVLQQYPPDLVALTYKGLLGSGGIEGVERLNRLYDDGGMQTQQIMTLFYVQMALDTEAPQLGLSLPSGFPDAWVEPSSLLRKGGASKRQNNDSTSSSLLELNSSRLQITIGKTLAKIGFEHVQEHVIGAEDIFSIHNHEIDTSSFPAEFLSIDIANLEQKIGIEVE